MNVSYGIGGVRVNWNELCSLLRVGVATNWHLLCDLWQQLASNITASEKKRVDEAEQ